MIKKEIYLEVEVTTNTMGQKIYVPFFMSLGKKKYLYKGHERVEFLQLEDVTQFLIDSNNS